jgi:hypothetical protein
MLRRVIGKEALRFSFLAESERLEEIERKQYQAIVKVSEEGLFTMADEVLRGSLLTLSQLLEKHYRLRMQHRFFKLRCQTSAKL